MVSAVSLGGSLDRDERVRIDLVDVGEEFLSSPPRDDEDEFLDRAVDAFAAEGGDAKPFAGESLAQVRAGVAGDDADDRLADADELVDRDPDERAGRVSARVAEHVLPGVEVSEDAADGEDPDRALAERQDHRRESPAVDEKNDTQRAGGDVADAEQKDEQRAQIQIHTMIIGDFVSGVEGVPRLHQEQGSGIESCRRSIDT